MSQTHTIFFNQGKFKKSKLSYRIHIFKVLENMTNLNLFKLFILPTKQVHITYRKERNIYQSAKKWEHTKEKSYKKRLRC